MRKRTRRKHWAISTLMLVPYPGVLFGSVMSLAGHTSADAFLPFIWFAKAVFLGMIAYPLVWLGALCVARGVRCSAAKATRGQIRLANRCSLIPLAYIAVVGALFLSLGVLGPLFG